MTPERTALLRQQRQERRARFVAQRHPGRTVIRAATVPIVYPVTVNRTANPRDAKARALALTFASWVPFTSKDGRTRGYGIPSSTAGKFYAVTLDDCDCPDSARKSLTCKHRRALQLVLEQQGRTAEFVPTPATEDRAWLEQFLATNARFPRTTRED